MLISISSSAYTWYKYTGDKRVKYNDHHPEFELTLKRNEIFGVAKNFTVVHEDELDIPFKLSKSELKHLLTNSVLLKYDHDMYPRLSLPCKEADIRRVYNFYNAKLFNNELPTDIKFRRITREGVEGMAGGRTNLKTGKFNHVMWYHPSSMTDVPFFCHVVIHEMIHVLNNVRYLAGDDSYRNAGHGPMFVKEMHRINALGYKILLTVKQEDYHIVESQETIYLATYQLSRGKLGFWSYTPFDPINILESLNLAGYMPSAYEYGTTQNSLAIKADPIVRGRPADKLMPKVAHADSVHIKTKLNFITDKMLSGFKPTVYKRIERDAPVDVKPSVENMTKACAKYLYLGKAAYVSNIFMNLGVKETNTYDMEFARSAIKSKGFNDSDFDYVLKSWYDIPDKAILAGGDWLDATRSILKNKMSNDSAINKIARIYNSDFAGRVEPERYARLAAQYFDIITLSQTTLMAEILKRIR